MAAEPPPADRPAIVVGDCEEKRKAGIDAVQIPPEGFVVKTAPNRVYLVGSKDGTSWAVVDFLERFVGVRWYWPAQYGGRSVPRRASLAIPPAHYRGQPVFAHRTMYQDWYWLQARSFDEQLLPMPPGVLPDGAQTLWMGDHFRLMRQGNSWPYEAVQHGARVYEFIGQVPKTNEALFAVMEDGNRNFELLCYSAPETLAFYLDGLERAWGKAGAGRPLPAMGSRPGGITRNSVTVWSPMDMGTRSLGAACHCPACRATLAKGGEELIIGSLVKRLCEDLRNRGFLAGTSVLSYGGACFITAAPTYYVWNRVLWNPELDVDATLDEMCRRLFGPAAASARELLRLQCERWEGTSLSRPLHVGENRIPPRLFREVWPPDVVARMKALRDKALAELAEAPDARKSFLYWTWAFDAFVEYAGRIEAVMAQGADAAPEATPSNGDAEARFGGGTADVNHARIARVRRQDGLVAGQSEVVFDLSWGHTWRAKWTEPAARNVTGRDLPIESRSAAWVFAKFQKPAGDGYSHSPEDASEIAYNLIQNCGDDSIEFDSASPMNLRVHHNFILDGMCLLSLCPVMGGGLTIDHNLFYNSPENGSANGAWIKLGTPWGSALPTVGMRLIHNTVVQTRDTFQWCGEGHRYENNVLENNVIYIAKSQDWRMPDFVLSRHSLYCGPRIDPKHISEMTHGDQPFVAMRPMDFNLRAESAAVDAGAVGKDYHHEARGKAPDLGAIELGDTWKFPRPGPRWAKGSEIANRPAPPASLPRKWVGLEQATESR
ncbi:MAG: hypothetical protein FJ290_31275 [Planctomycetes bacterium]|nr:hypothetical protein [Planctomycetota bacterium]